MGYGDHILTQRQRLSRLFRSSQKQRVELSQAPPPDGGMDRPIARRPIWQRYAAYGLLGVLGLVFGVWLLTGTHRHAYRVPIDRLTFGEVMRGPFEDFIAVR